MKYISHCHHSAVSCLILGEGYGSLANQECLTTNYLVFSIHVPNSLSHVLSAY